VASYIHSSNTLIFRSVAAESVMPYRWVPGFSLESRYSAAAIMYTECWRVEMEELRLKYIN